MKIDKVLEVIFIRSPAGNEPVKKWLKGLPEEEKRIIGTQIKEVQLGWPMGMPVVQKLEEGLFEIRIPLNKTDRIARILFGLDKNKLVLLHGFIKKTQKTPSNEKKIAHQRWKNYKS
jgi:phage-related protein